MKNRNGASGILGAQDAYYVGNFKGIGKVYQQTFIDTYSKVADAKLYTEKSAITAADMLNDRIIPFFDEQEMPLLRILTDRGTEYCGTLENHAYELFLSKALTTAKPRPTRHRQMAYAKDSIKP